ncbi:MAG: Bax inhibitor-1 family protein [Myxococcota bacterium]
MDQQTVEQWRQYAAGQGLELQVQPLPGGGFHCKAVPPGAAAPAQPQPAAGSAWGQQSAQPQSAQPQSAQPQSAQPGSAWGQQPAGGAWEEQKTVPDSASAWGHSEPQQQTWGQAPTQPLPDHGAPASAQPAAPQPAAPQPAAQYNYNAQQPSNWDYMAANQQAHSGPQAQPSAQPSAPAGGYGHQPPGAGAGDAAFAGAAAALQAGQAPAGEVPAADGAPVEVMAGVAPIGQQRVRYLRKVYSLLAVSAFLAIGAGYASITFGPTTDYMTDTGVTVAVPLVVDLMLGNELIFYGAFGLLFLSTLAASAVSKVKYLNLIALFGVALLMGVQLAPMVFVAQVFAGLGETMTANPVRDAGIMTAAVFAGITMYIFIARKDFSYLGSILSIGFWVIFAACFLTFVVDSEIFSLAVAGAGALLSAGFLLYVTSWIFKNSRMDDPVGDALAILVQLRNLFMFLLRIFMSRR